MTLKPVPGRAGLSRGLAEPTSSSGLGGGGGRVVLSSLRASAFFLPAVDLAFFPMVDFFVVLLYEIMQTVAMWCGRWCIRCCVKKRRQLLARGRSFCATRSLPSSGHQPMCVICLIFHEP